MVSDTSLKQIASWSIFLGYCVGFAIMVRPANIFLLLLLFVVACIFIFLQRTHLLSLGLLPVLSIAVGFILAVTPQVIYNFSSFHVLSFMPVANLGDLQLNLGTHSLKYLTNLSGGNPMLCYESPWTLGARGDGLAWYIKNPLIGFETVFMHLYGAIDYDYLFPYVYNLNIKYRSILFLFSQFVVFWGVLGYFYAVNELHKFGSTFRSFKSSAVYPLFTLTFFSLLVGWAAIHAFARNEVRYSLPIVAALLPLATWVVFIKLRSIKQNRLVYGLFFLYLLLAATLSSIVDPEFKTVV